MSDISCIKRNGIVFATYNRPEALNAFRNQTYDELHEILKDFVNDSGSKVLIITGAGRAFSAGQDLKELSSNPPDDLDEMQKHLQKTQEITRLIHGSDKPTIAAINGLAVGVGIEIALACTMRIAVEESYFQFAEVKRGLFQTNGTLYFLPRIVGLGHASQMLLTGEKISSERALACGLITRKVAASELIPLAENYALDLLAGSDHSLQLIQKGLRKSLTANLDEILEFEVKSNLALLESSSHLNGVKEFVGHHNS